jgi:hypothetical protein
MPLEGFLFQRLTRGCARHLVRTNLHQDGPVIADEQEAYSMDIRVGNDGRRCRMVLDPSI